MFLPAVLFVGRISPHNNKAPQKRWPWMEEKGSKTFLKNSMALLPCLERNWSGASPLGIAVFRILQLFAEGFQSHFACIIFSSLCRISPHFCWLKYYPSNFLFKKLISSTTALKGATKHLTSNLHTTNSVIWWGLFHTRMAASNYMGKEMFSAEVLPGVNFICWTSHWDFFYC